MKKVVITLISLLGFASVYGMLDKPISFKDSHDFNQSDYSLSMQNMITGKLYLQSQNYSAAIPFLEAAYNSGHFRLKFVAAKDLGIAYAKLGNVTAARKYLADAAGQDRFPPIRNEALTELKMIEASENLVHFSNQLATQKNK